MEDFDFSTMVEKFSLLGYSRRFVERNIGDYPESVLNNLPEGLAENVVLLRNEAQYESLVAIDSDYDYQGNRPQIYPCIMTSVYDPTHNGYYNRFISPDMARKMIQAAEVHE